MSRDWSWWDAWRSGDPDESSRSLAEEADRSLDKDPGRWSWGKRVEDTVEAPDRVSRYRGGHGHHGRPGKGGTTERHSWSQSDWEAARRDYLRQNENYLRTQRERDEAEDARARGERAWRDEVREAQHDARDDGRDEGKGIFW